MSKFQEGDIIVKDNFTYVCRIAGETESYFEHRWFAGLFKTPDNNKWGSAGCGGHPDHLCNKSLILFSDKCKLQSKTKENKRDGCCPKILYPVIGTYSECSSSFKLDVIRNIYPDEYKNYINFLHDRDIKVEEKVEEIKVFKEVKKKKK